VTRQNVSDSRYLFRDLLSRLVPERGADSASFVVGCPPPPLLTFFAFSE